MIKGLTIHNTLHNTHRRLFEVGRVERQSSEVYFGIPAERLAPSEQVVERIGHTLNSKPGEKKPFKRMIREKKTDEARRIPQAVPDRLDWVAERIDYLSIFPWCSWRGIETVCWSRRRGEEGDGSG